MITKITATLEDGSEAVLFPAPVVTPASDPVVEVDVKTQSGTEETFVPQA